MEDKTIEKISVHSKALKGHLEKLKEILNYALKEAHDAKLAQKEEKHQVLDLQERNHKTSNQSSDCVNMHQLIEEHNEALNSANDNGTTETIEELDKLHQLQYDKKGDAMEIGEER